ncbi:LL-diaminopimelate aminotransferase [Lottiidibacillus patelloidae]|uniref:Aminotransferase n=1 Tax=Lottiidibacillus patelloidae TaxID=2670334 RepID=A0A263BUV0_9BACI|nr:aminotransferase class I/II-fold pyridoxal phosphate-dependent enzyme [Lottiidibacillus patelloidae]OZM57107.1 LL-diaminopimelate aminotransferase [Lottiidibacillus patelloidae]
MDVLSNRLKRIPPYVFTSINKKKKELINEGIDIIDLGIGAPDLPTPPSIVNKLQTELASQQQVFQYSPFSGIEEFRVAVANYYKNVYNVTLDPNEEVLTLIGSKEGISHIVPALADKNDIVLIPDPSYPVYKTATYLADATAYEMPLLAKNDYLPDYAVIPDEILQCSKLMFLNYPNNPTSTSADIDFFSRTVAFAEKNSIAVAHDAAYQLMTFDNKPAPSILQVEGAKECCVEFGSFSKSFSMTGWRIGYVVGNKDIIKALATVKNNTDTCQFIPIQKAATYALEHELSSIPAMNKIFQQRRTIAVRLLNEMNLEVTPAQATFYLWVKLPNTVDTNEFCYNLLDKFGVVVTPGTAFGSYSNNNFRISLSVKEDRLIQAIRRIGYCLKQYGS